jgi:multiple sugar transport system ATP-binding protein
MSEVALSIKSVDKIYGGRGKGPVHAVKNLDMDVQRGEIVALLGSSGCGKTSTLRMIAGFEEVTRGDIVLECRLRGEKSRWRLKAIRSIRLSRSATISHSR